MRRSDKVKLKSPSQSSRVDLFRSIFRVSAVMQFNATARQCGDYCNLIFLICFSFSFLFRRSFFSSMNVSHNKNHNDFRSSIFNHFLCCMFHLLPFLFSSFMREGRKSYFFSCFVFSFDHKFTKNTYTRVMYQYSDSNLEWNFFTFFIFFENSLLNRFFYILLCRCVREYHKKILGKFSKFRYFPIEFGSPKRKTFFNFDNGSTCVYWIRTESSHSFIFHLKICG